MSSQPAPPVLVVIGPSGSGKSTLVRALADRGLLRVHPTWTTRPRRPDEENGSLEHRFVDEPTFDRLVGAGFFLDTVVLFGLPYRYGLPPIEMSTDGRLDTVMLRAPLVERFRRVIGHPAIVFQIEAEPERIRARLRQRSSSEADFENRLDDNDRETTAGRAVADRTFVNMGSVEDLAEAVSVAIPFGAAV